MALPSHFNVHVPSGGPSEPKAAAGPMMRWQRWAPQPMAMPKALDEQLRVLMPDLDLQRIRWCAGLPWFLGSRSWVSGIVLPHPWRPRVVRIHLRNWDRLSPEGQGLLMHEAVHALQMQLAHRPWALGLWHPFLLRYLAAWMRTGYYAHPLEQAAYAFEAEFLDQAFECPDPDAEEDADRLPMLAPQGLQCPSPWSGEDRERWWRWGLAALLLLPAALMYALLEAAARCLAMPFRSANAVQRKQA